jgi:hypothetical protein
MKADFRVTSEVGIFSSMCDDIRLYVPFEESHEAWKDEVMKSFGFGQAVVPEYKRDLLDIQVTNGRIYNFYGCWPLDIDKNDNKTTIVCDRMNEVSLQSLWRDFLHKKGIRI